MSAQRILLIIPELSMGGAQRSLSKLSLELAKDNNLWLVVFNKNSNLAYSYGGELLSLDVIPGSGIFGKTKAFFKRIIQLKKIKKKLNINVSISFLEGADYINILSHVADKVIISIRGSKLYDETIVGKFSWLRNKILIPWLYRKADYIVTVNHGIAQELKTSYGLGDSSIVTIGNFYNTEEIEKLSREPKSEKENWLYQSPVLITTGRLAHEKGLLSLLHVFYLLKQENVNIKLVMVGSGPCYEEIIKVCKKLNLVVSEGFGFNNLPDVVLAGNQPNIFKYLRGATLYLMNSSSEGFPNGLAEAMICRIPIVSTDCPYGPREIMAPEFEFAESVTQPYVSPNGLLMPMILSENDFQIWVKSLNGLLKNNELMVKFTNQAYERISEFNIKSTIACWNSIFD